MSQLLARLGLAAALMMSSAAVVQAASLGLALFVGANLTWYFLSPYRYVPLLLAGKAFHGFFIFDGDDMLDARVEERTGGR